MYVELVVRPDLRAIAQAECLGEVGAAVGIDGRANDAYAFNGRYNVSRSYGVNGQNQYTSAGPASFAYDANGNLVSDGSTSYVYDGENRLVSTSSGVSLRYDPLGRLWQVSGPSGTTRFLYDGDQLTAEYDASGNMLRRYVHGVGEDDPFVWYEGSGLGDRRSLMVDHQGSVIAVVNASGNPMRINAYDEYGIPKSDNLGRFQYTGQAYLPELGMYHYKARVYSPTLGRFLQTDPIGYDDQINLYAYVGNDPLNMRDPTGTQECGVCNADDRDNRAYLRGEITEDQLRERREARAAGGLAGLAIVGTAIATDGFGLPALARFAGRVLGIEGRAVVSSRAAIRTFSTQVERAGFKSAGEVGNVIGWGGGRNAAAQAADRTGQITKDVVSGMREQGLTKNLATAARDVYRSAVSEGTGGATAKARLELMDKILKNW